MSIAFVIDDLVVIQQFVGFSLLLPCFQRMLVAFNISQTGGGMYGSACYGARCSRYGPMAGASCQNGTTNCA